MKYTKRPILEAESDAVIRNYADGDSIKIIADRYQVSTSVVRCFLLSEGIKLRPKNRPCILADKSPELVFLFGQGFGVIELADKYGVNRDTMSATLKRAGVKKRSGLLVRSFHIFGDGNKGILAGLIMGEGSIVTQESRCCIRVVNQDVGIIDWLSQWGGKIHWSGPRERCPNPIAVWDLARAVDVFHCLCEVGPFIHGKKRRLVELGIEWLKSRHGFSETA